MKNAMIPILAMMTAVATAGELTVEVGGITPQQAIEKIRAAKKSGDKSAWVVRVKKGIHRIDKTLVFTPDDSGSESAPITWLGESGAIISGGTEIKGWKDEGNGVWSVPAPINDKGEIIWMEELWVNGRRAEWASFPKSSFLKMVSAKQVLEKGWTNRWLETAVFKVADIEPLTKLTAEQLAGVQMMMRHKWSFNKKVVRKVDAATGAVESIAVRPGPWKSWRRWNSDSNIRFANVPSAFTEPGEWIYDLAEKKIKYRPLPQEKIETSVLVMPLQKISRIIEFVGDIDRNRFVHDINFKGIAFMYTDVLPAPLNAKPFESCGRQAASYADGAITGEGVKRINFDNCTISHTGNHGIRFYDGSTKVEVTNCTLEDLGAGGIFIGARKGYVANGEELTRRIITKLAPRSTAFNVVSNCTIRAGGRYNPEGVGVVFTHASDCKLVYCDIHDFNYSGVSVGWTWGFKGSVAQRNEIAHNHIYDLGKRTMCDMGGVYLLGTAFGTKVHHNVIHDVYSYKYGGWGLYTDEGSEGVDLYCNLVYNTYDGGFHQHYGTDNILRNNIFVWNERRGSIVFTRSEYNNIPCSFDLVNNIIVTKRARLAEFGYNNPNQLAIRGIWANNCWFVPAGVKVAFGHYNSWSEWVASGRESGGIFADPKFFDLNKNDFRLKSDSPAIKLGFKVWDFSDCGRKYGIISDN